MTGGNSISYENVLQTQFFTSVCYDTFEAPPITNLVILAAGFFFLLKSSTVSIALTTACVCVVWVCVWVCGGRVCIHSS